MGCHLTYFIIFVYGWFPEEITVKRGVGCFMGGVYVGATGYAHRRLGYNYTIINEIHVPTAYTQACGD